MRLLSPVHFRAEESPAVRRDFVWFVSRSSERCVYRVSFLSTTLGALSELFDVPVNTSLPPSLLVLSSLAAIRRAQIKKAEALLKTYTRDSTCVPPLLQQMRSSQHEQARQLAAMLLKKKILTHWKKFNNQEKVIRK